MDIINTHQELLEAITKLIHGKSFIDYIKTEVATLNKQYTSKKINEQKAREFTYDINDSVLHYITYLSDSYDLEAFTDYTENYIKLVVNEFISTRKDSKAEQEYNDVVRIEQEHVHIED